MFIAHTDNKVYFVASDDKNKKRLLGMLVERALKDEKSVEEEIVEILREVRSIDFKKLEKTRTEELKNIDKEVKAAKTELKNKIHSHSLKIFRRGKEKKIPEIMEVAYKLLGDKIFTPSEIDQKNFPELHNFLAEYGTKINFKPTPEQQKQESLLKRKKKIEFELGKLEFSGDDVMKTLMANELSKKIITKIDINKLM